MVMPLRYPHSRAAPVLANELDAGIDKCTLDRGDRHRIRANRARLPFQPLDCGKRDFGCQR
jgi:hypothetical protein